MGYMNYLRKERLNSNIRCIEMAKTKLLIKNYLVE